MIFSCGEIKKLIKKIEPDTALWPRKHTKADLLKLAEGDAYTSGSQMQQDPTLLKGKMFKDSYWKHYSVIPLDIFRIEIFCDTAQKTEERHDYTVFQCWGKSQSGGIYLLDQVREKFEAPALETNLVDFWNKHKLRHPHNVGASKVWVEDKSSGSSLIQSIRTNYVMPIEGVPRNKDKVLRAFGVVNFFAAGYIFLPTEADWLYDYKEEFRKFSPMMTHKHDDQIDPTMDAVEKLLIDDSGDYLNAVSNKRY